jgi:YHS domain-containing protein
MKRFRLSITSASLAALVFLSLNNGAGASDTQGSTNNSIEGSQNSSEQTAANTAKVNVDTRGVILKGSDVVAYFKQGKAVKGNPAITSTFQGATYYFASAANKADFDNNPAKYIPQYGGFCAYGVANGVLADPEGPNAFAVYRGKLYVCGNEGALRSFKDEIESNIDKANKNWSQLAKP